MQYPATTVVPQSCAGLMTTAATIDASLATATPFLQDQVLCGTPALSTSSQHSVLTAQTGNTAQTALTSLYSDCSLSVSDALDLYIPDMMAAAASPSANAEPTSVPSPYAAPGLQGRSDIVLEQQIRQQQHQEQQKQEQLKLQLKQQQLQQQQQQILHQQRLQQQRLHQTATTRLVPPIYKRRRSPTRPTATQQPAIIDHQTQQAPTTTQAPPSQQNYGGAYTQGVRTAEEEEARILAAQAIERRAQVAQMYRQQAAQQQQQQQLKLQQQQEQQRQAAIAAARARQQQQAMYGAQNSYAAGHALPPTNPQHSQYAGVHNQHQQQQQQAHAQPTQAVQQGYASLNTDMPLPLSLPLPPPPPPPPPPPRSSQNALGLKNFTGTVANKLKQYGRSSYTAVADELVHEVVQRLTVEGKPFNHAEVDKNIRRRVYDALNVFSSMRVVERAGKDVIWRGTAGLMEMLREGEAAEAAASGGGDESAAQSSPASCNAGNSALLGGRRGARDRLALSALRRSLRESRAGVAAKRARVAELRSQHDWLRRVVTRNAARDAARVTTGGMDGAVDVGDDMAFRAPDQHRVQLPFVLVGTDAGTAVRMQVEDGRENVMFELNGKFRMMDGYDVVAKVCQMGGEATAEG